MTRHGKIGVGLIGSGFMGKAYALGYATAARVFGRPYYAGDGAGRRGFRTVFAGPEHEPYGAFCVAPGHQLGFNDLKAIEAREKRWLET